MKLLINTLVFATGIVLFSSCGGEKDVLQEKKDKLAELRTQVSNLNTEIGQLENEITELDPEFGTNSNNIILVTTVPLIPDRFEHKIEVRGTLESRKNVMVSAQISGRIDNIRVKEGEMVKKGQTLLRLDAEIIENNIAELNTALDLAKVVYERQANLWAKKIGTEIQFLEAKNTKESLERRLATAKSQLAQATIQAPFSGSVDEVPVKIGEMAAPGLPLVRIVNPNEMYISADVSESHIGKFKQGDIVEVHFPAQNQNITSKISAVSQVINRDNRTFTVEIEVPKVGFLIKPNQVSILKLTDYVNDQAIAIPTKMIQRDDKGTFVYGTRQDDGSLVAKKIHVEVGLSFASRTEVISGLAGDEQLIDAGFRDVTDGVEVRVAAKETASN